MNRTILFRGKKITNSKWVYGSLVVNQESGQTYIMGLPNGDDEVIPSTVGQFTGLTDKNGNKVFEGDIVFYDTSGCRKGSENTHKVVFETRGGSSYFGITIDEIETWQFCMEVPAKLMEVVGNIHDDALSA